MYKKYRKLVEHLRTTLCKDFSLSIRRMRMPPNLDGLCVEKGESNFSIRIDKDLPECYAIETLLHELAHVLAWGKDSDVHGTNWGKTYSVVYRDFLGWNEKVGKKYD